MSNNIIIALLSGWATFMPACLRRDSSGVPPPLPPGPVEAVEARAPGDSARLKLVLTPVGGPWRDRIAIRVAATNAGHSPVRWDREFSVFLRWHVKTGDGDYLEASPVTPAPPAASKDIKARFVDLAPGQTISKEIELTDKVLMFSSIAAYGRDGTHTSMGSERFRRFVVPGSVQELTVHAEYLIGREDEGGVPDDFGETIDEIKLPQTHTVSNNLKSNLNDF